MTTPIAQRAYPTSVINDLRSGYSINIPAEWQSPNTGWWRDRDLAQRFQNVRAELGIILHDALWAFLHGDAEPDPDADNYSFDRATQRYTRTDVRL